MSRAANINPILPTSLRKMHYEYDIIMTNEFCYERGVIKYVWTDHLYAELRSRPIFGGSGSDPSKIKRIRLRLLVNCKAANYEFVTTKKKIFSSLIQNYRIYMFDFRNNFLYQGRKQGFGSAFFCGSGSGSLGYPGEGVGGGGKGKKWFFLVFFSRFRWF